MADSKDDQRKRLRRHPVALQRDCSLGVITFKNLAWTDHHARIVDFSAAGLGIESDIPIEPGIIWFKDCLYGQKCGVLVWCQQNGLRYRAGIQFISLNQNEEEYLRRQIEGSQQCKTLQDPQRIVAALIDSIRKDGG